MVTGILFILIFFLGAFFWRKKQLAQRFNEDVKITADYMIQQRPGQYSCDRNAKSGVFIFHTERANDTLKNVVIKKVKPLNPALNVNLEQNLLISLEKATTAENVSVRFKIVKKGANTDDLKGVLISISGVLNFKKGNSKKFTAVLPIAGLYQAGSIAHVVDLQDTPLLANAAELQSFDIKVFVALFYVPLFLQLPVDDPNNASDDHLQSYWELYLGTVILLVFSLSKSLIGAGYFLFKVGII